MSHAPRPDAESPGDKRVSPGQERAARLTGYATFILIGWTGLLVPSLIRSLEHDLNQTDAGIGVFYFVYAVGYALGSFAGGFLTERFGRHAVLTLGAAAHGVGLVALGLSPGWSVFLVLAAPTAFGAGVIDGGMNGLFLDLFTTGRGRALNNLHLFFGVGALAAPLTIGLLTEVGLDWRPIIAGTGVAAGLLAVAVYRLHIPSGRRRVAAEPGPAEALPGPVGAGPTAARSLGLRRSIPLLILGFAIAAYVASEIGVSNWLVRFLEDAPLVLATASLSLFWGGLAIGRLVSARVSDRFDHAKFAATAAGIAALALVGAVLIPSLPLSIALFALVGFAYGPVFPLIVVVGGERYPTRASTVSGILVGLAVVGGIIYPPAMGFISVSFGLSAAMLGAAAMSGACAMALLLVTRLHVDPARVTKAEEARPRPAA
jgi:fucose permease